MRDRRQLWAGFTGVNDKKAFSISSITVKKSGRGSFVWISLTILTAVNSQGWWTVESWWHSECKEEIWQSTVQSQVKGIFSETSEEWDLIWRKQLYGSKRHYEELLWKVLKEAVLNAASEECRMKGGVVS